MDIGIHAAINPPAKTAGLEPTARYADHALSAGQIPWRCFSPLVLLVLPNGYWQDHLLPGAKACQGCSLRQLRNACP